MSDYIKREDVVEKLVRTFLLQAPTARAIVEAIPAADAIEDLQKCVDGLEADNDNLCERIKDLSKWIPVTERLPNVDEKVLTFARNKYDGSWFMDITSWTGVRNHDEYQFWGYGYSMKVTHWMPLPEPPKEGEE